MFQALFSRYSPLIRIPLSCTIHQSTWSYSRFWSLPYQSLSSFNVLYFNRRCCHLPNGSKSILAWKSSKIQTENQEKIDRTLWYEKLRLDEEFVNNKEELTLFEITNHTRFRAFFFIIILQYAFWVFCATNLFAFYDTLNKNKHTVECQSEYEKTKHQMGFFKRIRQYFSVYGAAKILDPIFILIGHLITVSFFFLLARCVVKIRLLPGGRQVKIFLYNWHGGLKAENKALTYNLNDVTVLQHRKERCNYYSLRVADSRFAYLMDFTGRFPHEKIYDRTVGIYRRNVVQKPDNK